MGLSLTLYGWVARLARPLVRRKLARRAVQEPGYAQRVEQRFGNYGDLPRYQAVPEMPLVWIHAVSLGETRAAAILLRELRLQIPALRLLLTNGTATGREEGQKLLLPGDIQVWQPWDDCASVSAFLCHFRPTIGILMETEMWPGLAAGCQREHIPLVLANARLNEKSLRGAQRLAWLARPAYRSLRSVIAQTEADASRLRAAGAEVTAVLGNLKFDVEPDAAQLAQGQAWHQAAGKPVVMLASSREGEEALWLQALAQLRSSDPQAAASVQWLLVPRHPQRFDEIVQLLQGAGLQVSRRSQWQSGPQPADVWLGDSMGEMQLYYGLADVALLGGSFAPLGGQNLIEAAACGCPVVMGPHTFNFAQAADSSVQADAALRVAGMDEGLQQAVAIASDTSRHSRMRRAALQFAQAHRGAAKTTAQLVAAVLESTEGFVNSSFEASLFDEDSV
ncbi:3-deoxy-D-manno-octulosonic acid transferase [Comamonas sp. JNW]|uniref:3-deoxy-D-manno-octulosonic acid transferase n=1 Tax=unclassified Comamonas TaxID=2638500 RepID=UPI000DE7BC38|nr:3-deoxy-D-manno-octulosonic acid transferase [Comamonas sp. JNW]PWB20885.1 3-deoxy-D-manno-octulosonic acid transferase [Comamonas sp. JNW]